MSRAGEKLRAVPRRPATSGGPGWVAPFVRDKVWVAALGVVDWYLRGQEDRDFVSLYVENGRSNWDRF